MDFSGSMNSSSRVCAMRDHRYPSKRGYSRRLYNLAWARAVHSRSVDTVRVKANTDVEARKKAPPSPPSFSSSIVNEDNPEIASIVMERVVGGGSSMKETKVESADAEEDDELEEGEINSSSDSEIVEKLEESVEEDANNGLNTENESDLVCENGVENMVNSVTKTLQEFTGPVSEETFVGVCSRIEGILERLSEVIPSAEEVVGKTFSSIEKINSVFYSMNQNEKHNSQEVLSRLLICAMSQTPSVFSTDHVKEMDMMMLSLADPSMFCNEEPSAMVTESEDSGGLNEIDMVFDPPSLNHLHKTRQCSILERSSSISNSIRGFELLLDLENDHVVDSLPSPTRECSDSGFTTPVSSFLPVTRGMVQVSATHETHPYETEALKAVCSYQQKFCRTSFSSSDLPSPTPSEESTSDNDDVIPEVSSGRNADFIKRMKSSPVETTSSTSKDETVKNGFLVNETSDARPVTRFQARNRDPRLRQFKSTIPTLGNGPGMAYSLNPTGLRKQVPNEETVVYSLNSTGLRKQVPNEETCVVGPPVKRPRHAMLNSETCETREEDKRVSVEKGVMDTMRLADNQTVSVSDEAKDKHSMGLGRDQLSSILKDISVNPTLLMKLLRMDQIPDKATSSPAGNAFGCAVTQDQGPDSGKIKMKPRDPRRILQNGMMLKAGTTGSEQMERNVSLGTTPGGNGTILSFGMAPSDITQQFTSNLKNIADLVSLTTVSTPVISQVSSTLPVKVSTDKINKKSDILDPVVVPIPGDSSVGLLPSQHHCWEDMERLLEGYDENQKAAIHMERARRMEEQKRMFSARKLCLVLDLDHTLLNSAKFFEVDPVHDEILRRKEEQDREKQRRHLFRFPHMGMWTKLRPGIWNFLEKASKLYELHLYTMGNKPYATEMAKVLDPKGVLFSGRVISRGDDGDTLDGDERAPKSKDLEGVLGMESAVVIIDDSLRVWPHNKLNLIVVERYTYFPCSRRQFGLAGPSLLEIDHDERPEEGTLASSLAVIEKIHQIFFSQHSLDDVDVRNILGSEQKKILSGCRVVFSRVFPVGEANPHMHPLWQTAEQFGATCTNQIDGLVTHVVANSLGTDKVNWALSNGRWVVHPGWVEASALLYRRANEKDFAVKP